MTLRWLIASLHLAAFGIGAGAIFARARALQLVRDVIGLRWVFLSDNLWGLAALLWVTTGIWRAFGGLEKGTAYYIHQPLFHLKLGLFGALVLLEIWPMVTLILWRRSTRRLVAVDLSRAPALARVSYLQCVLVFAIVFVAAALARGLTF